MTRDELKSAIGAYLGQCANERTVARANEFARVVLGLSVRHVDRLSVALLGLPTMRAIRNRQVSRAGQLLRESDTPLDEIGIVCGFGDRRSFFRAIKRAHGRTPGELRENG